MAVCAIGYMHLYPFNQQYHLMQLWAYVLVLALSCKVHSGFLIQVLVKQRKSCELLQNSWPKLVIFAQVQSEKIGSDETLLYSPWDW